MRPCLHARFCASLIITSLMPAAQAGEFSGYVGAEIRQFFESPLSPEQHDSYVSGIAQPEYFHEWDDGTQNLEVILFYIKDQYDEQRTHGDIRELAWTGVFDDWEVRAGISKVFWGVAETQHLVDIINQTDLVVNVDGEDKLGQPMLRLTTERDWGTLSFFILPGFRERTYPGVEGRPRTETVVDTDLDAIYDSSSGKDHIDFAGRYSHYIGDWEFGLSLFSGTGRDPTDFSPVAFDSTGNPTVVVPVYSLINRIGFDGQAFFGDWTWKLEAANTEVRSGSKKGINSFQSVAGFEYTLVGIAESRMDLGLVVEYHYSDERISDTIYDNDLATALRFVFNDIQSTEVLTGIFTDANTQSIGSFIEASRRLGDSWTLEAQVRAFHGTTANRPLYSYRFDDFAQIDLNYHF
jgi:hypothetical protein